ncbi:MAG TPA: S8 family serine peptidase [Longimicrobium sp.]|nr:S8 family serine peptidase [Longimicrobium sp.]
MKRFGMMSALFAAAALAACSPDLATGPAAAPRAPAHEGATAPGQYLVTFKGQIPADFAQRVAALGGTVLYQHAGIGFAAVAGLTDDAAVRLGTSTGVADVSVDAEFQADIGQSVETELNDVAESQTSPATAARYPFQWNMRFIHASAAWSAGKLGSSSVTAAIIDTGLDYTIPDLNGLVDLSRSVSFVPSDNALNAAFFPTRHPVDDYNGHGTNVATQVSSKAFALAGVTSRTTLIGVKVLGRTGSGSTSGVLAGLAWAADHGANVANMSLGGSFLKAGNGQFVALFNKALNYAKQKGMLVVVSAGNSAADLDHDGNQFVTYCSATHVICVSSVGPVLSAGSGDIPSYYTNYGRSAIGVAAPGGNAGSTLSAWPWGNDSVSWVWSYCPKFRIAGLTTAGVPVLTACQAGNRLSGFIGTSQASPHVTGLAALLMAEYGTDAVQTRHRILTSALDMGETGTDPFFGRGRIDVAAALGL